MPFGKTPEAKASGEKSTISQADTNGQASPRFSFYSLFVKRPRELAITRGKGRAVASNTVASSVLQEISYKRKQKQAAEYLKRGALCRNKANTTAESSLNKGCSFRSALARMP